MSVEITPEKLQGKKLFVGTPMYGSKCQGAYLRSILSLLYLCNALNVPVGVSTISNESLVQRSRNYIVDEFLRSDFTHLMFIDTDIVFNPEYVIAMLVLDQEVVGVPYSSKTIHWETIVKAVHQNVSSDQLCRVAGNLSFEKHPLYLEKNLVEVDTLMMGFTMIKRQVLDKLRVAYPEHYYRPDHIGTPHFDGIRNIQMFFSVEVDESSQTLLTEYEFFCQKWKAIGGKMYSCPWMVLSHIGLHSF